MQSVLDKISSTNEAILLEYIQLISKRYGIPEEELINIQKEEEANDNTKEISKMTVSELKKLCTSLGLRKQSTKPKLIQILQDHYRGHDPRCAPVPLVESVIIIQDKKSTTTLDEDDDDSDTSFDDTFILDDDDSDQEMMDGV